MRAVWVLLFALCLPLSAAAQSQPVTILSDAPPANAATLIADKILVTPERSLIATGGVEMFSGTTRLVAQSVRFDDASGQLLIEGPIRLQDGDSLLILADQAALDQDLQDGILAGARFVLHQQLQLAAAQVTRKGDRYTLAYKVAATSCQICSNHPPIWQIRAKRIVHDREEKQLYFDQAQLRLFDIPVFWVPRMRLPDPTLDRATGFLIPALRTTSQLGTGIKLPYFIKLGDHRDLTLAPYLSKSTRTLDYRYRQAFAFADFEIAGAFTRDDLRRGETRGYVDLSYRKALGRGYELRFGADGVSDDAYFLDYGISSQDFTTAALEIDRFTRDKLVSLSLQNVNSLRASDVNAEIPTTALDLSYVQRFFPTTLGGEASVLMDVHSHYRYSDTDGVQGRDVSRLTFSADWQKQWITTQGLVVDALAQANFDFYDVAQDSAFPEPVSNLTPYLAAKASYPMTRHSGGVTHTLTPTVQLVWSETDLDGVPNEDSTRVEFDEGNLFGLSRAPGFDARETGARLNAGLTFGRFAQTGWNGTFTVGRVFRSGEDTTYSLTSGVSGGESDWLLAAALDWQSGLRVNARMNVDDNLNLHKSSTRINWRNARFDLGAAHLYLVEDPGEDRTTSVNELSLAAGYKINDFWSSDVDWRYDFAGDRTSSAELGLTYENECVAVQFSVSRRFTSSTILEPTTDFGLTVGLRGFGVGSSPAKRRACSAN